MNLFVFGSSLLSAYWNGAATYYRGIYRSLHRLRHRITFAEPDIYDRKRHRDLAEAPEYARVIVYRGRDELDGLIEEAASTADVVIKHSGVGEDDAYLERRVVERCGRRARTVFWDVDAPATLDRVLGDPRDPMRACIPRYDLVLTYGGGQRVVEAYRSLGARVCVPIYNALDPQTHHAARPDRLLQADLLFMGNRLPDREARVEAYFLAAAELCPERTFLLGGEGWGDKRVPSNVRVLGHCPTATHNTLNSSAAFVLNINRASMAEWGFSPPTRIFEAAGAAACIITDAWHGIDAAFEPGREILVARDAKDVAAMLTHIDRARAREIGRAALERALRCHTYDQRALQVDQVLSVAGTRTVVAGP